MQALYFTRTPFNDMLVRTREFFTRRSIAMANLGNDEKSKIREEEVFRFEVQKELASQLPKKRYLLTRRIFNSRIMVAAAIGAMG